MGGTADRRTRAHTLGTGRLANGRMWFFPSLGRAWMAGMGMWVIYTGPGRVDLVIRLVVLRAFLHGSAAFILFSTVLFSCFVSCFLCWRDGWDGWGGGGIQIPLPLTTTTLLLLLRYYRPCVHLLLFYYFFFYYWKRKLSFVWVRWVGGVVGWYGRVGWAGLIEWDGRADCAGLVWVGGRD